MKKRLAASALAAMMLVTAAEIAPVSASAKANSKSVEYVSGEKSYKIDGKEYFKYSLKYPKLTAKTKAAKKVNKIIKSRYTKTIKDYKADAKEFITKYGAENFITWAVKAETKLTYNKNGKYSFRSMLYIYTGGAHGMSGVVGLNYSKKTGKIIPNSKLTSYSNKTLKNKIVKKVEKEIEKTPEKFNPGALDTVKNRSIKNFVFWLKGNSLHVFFNQYDLSPYMGGTTEITIKL